MKPQIAFFLWLLFIAWEVRRNYRIIEVHKESPDYLNSFFVRAFFGLLCLVISSGSIDPFLEWWESIPFAMYQLSSFYLLFDPWLNLRRKKPIDYRGANSGWLDPILSRVMWWTLKGLCLIALVYSTICIWRSL